jgi:type IV pilus assembly protein PilQ
MRVWQAMGWMIAVGIAAGAGAAAASETASAPMEPPRAAAGAAAAGLDEEMLPEPMRLSMEFQDANLKDVLKTFSQQTGINVITGGEIGDQPVTLYLENVTVLDALDQILRAGNLTYERAEGSDIYLVKPRPAEEGVVGTVTRVYRLRFARVSASNLAKVAAKFSAMTPFEGSVIKKVEEDEGAAAGGASAGGAGGGGGSEVFGVDTVLKPLLTERGTVIVDGRTNRLIVTDVPQNFPRIEAALAALDVKTPQILIESELIETTLAKAKDLGIEWGTGTEGQIASFASGATRSTRFPFGGDGGGGKFPLSTLSFTDFDAVMQALEIDTDTKILARPKVLTLDNEPAIIRLSTDEAIGLEITITETSVTSEVERATTGVVMAVTPQVNDDGYITMLLEPSVTRVSASSLDAPSTTADPLNPKSRGVRTMVRLRSGDTLVIGGLIDRQDIHGLRKVPILSGVPFLGETFKRQELDDSSSELLIFLTPTIQDEGPATRVAQQAAASAAGPREQEPAGGREDAMEQSLNQLEGPAL